MQKLWKHISSNGYVVLWVIATTCNCYFLFLHGLKEPKVQKRPIFNMLTCFPACQQFIPAEHVLHLRHRAPMVNNAWTDRHMLMGKQKPISFHIPVIMYLAETRLTEGFEALWSPKLTNCYTRAENLRETEDGAGKLEKNDTLICRIPLKSLESPTTKSWFRGLLYIFEYFTLLCCRKSSLHRCQFIWKVCKIINVSFMENKTL